MKFIWIISSLALSLLIGCSPEIRDDSLQTEDSKAITPFNVSFDMTSDDVRALYSDCEFVSAHPNKYGFCSAGENGIEVLRNDEVLFYYWENGEGEKAGPFVLFDPSQSYKGVYVGMKLSDYLEKDPKAESWINLISYREMICADKENYCLVLDSEEGEYAAEYHFDEHGESNFVRFIDTEKKIESITIENSN